MKLLKRKWYLIIITILTSILLIGCGEENKRC